MRLEFYVDYCEEGGGGLSGRYGFSLEVTESEFQAVFELYRANEEFSKWGEWWKPGDELFEKVNTVATKCINEIMSKESPGFPIIDPIDVLWTLSPASEIVFDKMIEAEE